MKKIAIIGSGGAGKSTLARKLGDILNIEVIHLDSIFWKPGWIETVRDEWIKTQYDIVNKDSWIVDGNYSGTMDIRLNNADTIIFLDLPRIICLYRVMKRWIKYQDRTRPDMAEGCPEKLDKQFIKWVWEYPNQKRPNILHRLEILAHHKQIVHLKSTSGVSNFVESIGNTNTK